MPLGRRRRRGGIILKLILSVVGVSGLDSSGLGGYQVASAVNQSLGRPRGMR
jgi:hypothetical protein